MSHISTRSFPPESQHPPPWSTKQWMKFAGNTLNHIPSVSEPATLDWAFAIIIDSDELPCNLQEIARVIAKTCDLNYLPSLTLFGENRALFFFKNMADSIKVSSAAHLRMGNSSIFLNKYPRMVNVIDNRIFAFRGWISIKGLLFDS